MNCSFGLHPVRSISLPSRLHPTSLKVDSELDKLKIWEASLPSLEESVGAQTILKGLHGLAELYNSVEELLHTTRTQESISHHQDGKVFEEALEGSVTLLDAGGCAKDLLSRMKEHVQGLQSSLRRRGGGSIQQDVNAYNAFRKKAKKEALKCIRSLKRAEGKFLFLPLLDLDPHLLMVIRVLRELSNITSVIFRYLLLFLSTPSLLKTKLGGCSLISKLMPVGLVVNEKGKKINNEVGRIDVALCNLNAHARDTGATDEVRTVQNKLKALAVNINGLESGIDTAIRRLIQYRVSLLNVLTR